MGEGSFDDIAPLVGVLIERMEPLASWILLDHGGCSSSREELAKGIAVIGGIAQQRFRWWQRFDQSGGGFDVMAIAASQSERDEPAVSVDDRVYFRGPAAPASANGLLFGPPFPPAAQRCALAVVLSMH